MRVAAIIPALALLGAAPNDDCAALLRLPLPHAAIDRAELLAGGICRVSGIARPVPRSTIRFEIRLPPAARWSGRYYQMGNGGFAGRIDAPTLAEAAARGDAVAGTDTGHAGDGFDASWADGRPEALLDYGSRSIKATSDAAARVVRAYYGRPAAHRYAMGCSNGGRMALMAAARWPDDWDGVIAGAPANPWSAQLAAFQRIQHRLRATPGGWIGPETLPAIRAAALAACPAGTVIGGIARRPLECRLDVARLACQGAGRDGCLTLAQQATLSLILAEGYQPAAMIPSDWARWIVRADPTAPSQLTFARQADLHLPRGAALAPLVDVGPADLDAFRRRGGRILSYFGWADAVIAPTRGLDWYRSVQARYGEPQSDAFYRLFMVPGMIHCQGGEGATAFGQSVSAPALHDSPEYDIRRALEAWVEDGAAPRALVAWAGDRGSVTQRLEPIGQ